MTSPNPDTNRPTGSSKFKAKNRKNDIVDSWEDDEVSSDLDGDGGGDVASAEVADRDDCSLISLPPPTPSSPSASDSYSILASTTVNTTTTDPKPQSPGRTAAQRPQKTDAVARRMIAGALGLKAPKQTEEQKAYDKAIRGRERKRQNGERSLEQKRKLEAEKARAAIWND